MSRRLQSHLGRENRGELQCIHNFPVGKVMIPMGIIAIGIINILMIKLGKKTEME